MQILTSRSTVALDDRQVIEQLIFTAKELAATAARTPGFEHAGESNQRLALEMWEGAAYACRVSEQVTIKNIFLCNFLERLTEISRAAQPAVTAAEPIRPPRETDVGPQSRPFADQEISVEVPRDEAKTSFADECVPEFERESGEEETAGSAVDRDPAPIELTAHQPSDTNDSEEAQVTLIPAVPVARGAIAGRSNSSINRRRRRGGRRVHSAFGK